MNVSNEKAKDFIAGIVALLFVISAGYLALNRFNIGEGNLLSLGTGGQEMEGETSSTSDVRADESNVAGAMDDNSMTLSDWHANDYVKGDISSGSYTVLYGDTLWEIAEAVYGDGTMWVNILNANIDNVDFLPDGSQALIYAGQTLLIP